ncbi:50S ribosomal protein L24 [Candidatus Jidaibacter acanthamoebae]|nr:50S ribosomal protein L24 [Candidatus Jidaibacter acanthamoeba]
MALKLKMRKGDKVIIITGKDKGKKGEVIKVLPTDNKVVVSGLNIAHKHVKPSKTNPQGGIIPKEMPLNISNVAHVDPKTDMPTKVGFKFLADGKKIRYAKRSGEVIDNLK